jgi:hypothetical protein
MSVRALNFLESWIHKYVSVTDKGGGDMRAMVLANHCIAEAAAQGIPMMEMEQECGSVESIILEAMLRLKESETPKD